MSEDLKNLIQTVCQEVNADVFKVYEVFEDYFGEDRVDLQLYASEEWVENHKHFRLLDFISRDYVLHSSYFDSLDAIKKGFVQELLDKGALKCTLVEDRFVTSYFLPIILSKIAENNPSCILIHWPQVEISNEFDDSTIIEDLYAKVRVSNEGRIVGTFGLNRTKYPLSHLLADYMHSHIPGLNTNELSRFLNPCLGSGPINGTITSLVRDNDLMIWQLFCRELDVYVTVESISGVPYRRMSAINGNENLVLYNDKLAISGSYVKYYRDDSVFKPFFKYLLSQNVLKYNFCEGNFGIAMSYKDCVLGISNAFIDFINTRTELSYNEALGYLDKVIVKDGKLMIPGNRYGMNKETFLRMNGKPCFKFKGNTLTFNVYDDTFNNEMSRIHVLKPNYITSILNSIITFLNINYGRNSEEIGANKESVIL